MTSPGFDPTPAVFVLDGLTLTVHPRGEWLRGGGREPDLAWHHVDGAGHGHHAVSDGCGGADYPTLRVDRVGRCTDPDHDEDCPGVAYWACRHCGERVTPGTREAPDRWVSQPPSYSLEVHGPGSTAVRYEFSHADWGRLRKAWAAAAAEVLVDHVTAVTLAGPA